MVGISMATVYFKECRDFKTILNPNFICIENRILQASFKNSYFTRYTKTLQIVTKSTGVYGKKKLFVGMY